MARDSTSVTLSDIKPPPSSKKELDFGEATEQAREVAPPRAVAVVIRMQGAASPQELRLETGACTIGSDRANDIVVRDPTVSRRHARVELVPEGVRVTDLESRNGTTYMGQRFASIVLSLGAQIRVGRTTVVFDPDVDSLYSGLEYTGGPTYRGVLGASLDMRRLFALLQRLEGSLATVLIEGESGSGKERVARAIHSGSPVSSGPMITLNCGAIAANLVSSELFGHRRGAFTGAVDTRQGAFESADGGTLFLDEIGELPLDVQPALLRALELGEIRPVGDDKSRHVKVRVIAATNRDLQAEIEAGRFREDLFFRLAVVRINVPPLRNRPEDVELLAHAFAREAGIAELPDAVIEELKSRTWRGNARELRNAIVAYAAVGSLPPGYPGTANKPDDSLGSLVDLSKPYALLKEEVVDQFTRIYIMALLKQAGGNQSAAARMAGLDRTYFGRLLAKYGIDTRRKF